MYIRDVLAAKKRIGASLSNRDSNKSSSSSQKFVDCSR